MMSEDEARKALEYLVNEYMPKHPQKDALIGIIWNKSRPGLPIRGVLEDMRTYRNKDYSKSDLNIIDDLIYQYG